MTPPREFAAFCACLALLIGAVYAPALSGRRVLSPSDVARVQRSFERPGRPSGTSFEPSNRLLTDPMLQFEPWLEWSRASIRSGQLPLWNDLAGCGAPHLANGQAAVFDPFNVIAYVGTMPARDRLDCRRPTCGRRSGHVPALPLLGARPLGTLVRRLRVSVRRVHDALAALPAGERGGLAPLADRRDGPGDSPTDLPGHRRSRRRGRPDPVRGARADGGALPAPGVGLRRNPADRTGDSIAPRPAQCGNSMGHRGGARRRCRGRGGDPTRLLSGPEPGLGGPGPRTRPALDPGPTPNRRGRDDGPAEPPGQPASRAAEFGQGHGR